jgi:hypothetical protein
MAAMPVTGCWIRKKFKGKRLCSGSAEALFCRNDGGFVDMGSGAMI